MKNIIIVLFRSELNYLIKYDWLRTSSDRIIPLSYYEFDKLSEERQVDLLQNSMPIYEQEHEILLIQYSRNLEYDNAPLLKFEGIKSIIPLSEIGSRLLISKLNNDLKISKPLSPSVYSSFTNHRSHILRNTAGTELCSIYKLEVPKDDFISDFKAATLFQLNNQNPEKKDSTLAHLVDFNTTPSFIPEGNIEAVLKTACVGMKKTGIDIEKTKSSMFYKFVIENKERINGVSFYKALKFIEEKIQLESLNREPFRKLKNVLSENGKLENAFTIYSYFYFLKKKMEKNEYDISSIKDNVLELKYHDIISTSKVLFMLGYTFSMQTISKSLQSYSSSPLLKSTRSLDLNWKPEIVEELSSEEFTKRKPIKEEAENEKANNIISNQNNYNEETEQPIEVELTVDIKPINSVTNIESKINDDSEKDLTKTKAKNNQTNKDLFSNTSSVNDSSDSIFTFKEFQKNLKKRKTFLSKILEELKSTKIEENQITKGVLIKCLKNINEYEKQKGGLKVAAIDALKIFDKDE